MDVLIAKDEGSRFRITGTQPFEKPVVDSNSSLLKASKNTLDIVKYSLRQGFDIFVSKNITTSEVIPSDLVISESDDPLVAAKNIAINDINNLMHQNVFGLSILDSMDYLDCLLKLMAAGIFITDENREDKYFEIIEAAQTEENPEPLSEDSTIEDEQKYIEQKRKYDQAQKNLTTLEKYLNAYDKISTVRFVSDMLNSAHDAVKSAKSVEEVENAVREYCEKVKRCFRSENQCTT